MNGLIAAADAEIPLRQGVFRFHVFRQTDDPSKEHIALVCGDPRAEDALVRIHSGCMDGEVFGSLKCDCAKQLDRALAEISEYGRGILVYLRDERGPAAAILDYFGVRAPKSAK